MSRLSIFLSLLLFSAISLSGVATARVVGPGVAASVNAVPDDLVLIRHAKSSPKSGPKSEAWIKSQSMHNTSILALPTRYNFWSRVKDGRIDLSYLTDNTSDNVSLFLAVIVGRINHPELYDLDLNAGLLHFVIAGRERRFVTDRRQLNEQLKTLLSELSEILFNEIKSSLSCQIAASVRELIKSLVGREIIPPAIFDDKSYKIVSIKISNGACDSEFRDVIRIRQ
jgi:hypothetical protein